jgi:uncharacterized protein (DUF983 family)
MLELCIGQSRSLGFSQRAKPCSGALPTPIYFAMHNPDKETLSYGSLKEERSRKAMFKAMLQCKCPVCTKGDMFKTRATKLARFNELKAACKVCGFRFMPEPGFYQLSLYFTYAVCVAFVVIFGFATYYLLNDPPLWVYYLAILLPTTLATPWSLRYSKVVMLYAFGNVWPSRG